MTPELHPAEHPSGVAVLLHPHPDYGGNRFHPFVDGLYRCLPGASVSTVRFDFSTGDVGRARQEAAEVTEAARHRWPDLPVVVVGYSFGAAVAAAMAPDASAGDPTGGPFAGWLLLAPPLALLDGATVGQRPEPKAVWVPERDQFSPPAAVRTAVADWVNTEVTVVPGADHFLGAVTPIVRSAAEWVAGAVGADRPPGGDRASR